MGNEAYPILTGPAGETSAFKHLVEWHNWTEEELRELFERHPRSLSAWGIHRLEHSDTLINSQWEHGHG